MCSSLCDDQIIPALILQIAMPVPPDDDDDNIPIPLTVRRLSPADIDSGWDIIAADPIA